MDAQLRVWVGNGHLRWSSEDAPTRRARLFSLCARVSLCKCVVRVCASRSSRGQPMRADCGCGEHGGWVLGRARAAIREAQRPLVARASERAECARPRQMSSKGVLVWYVDCCRLPPLLPAPWRWGACRDWPGGVGEGCAHESCWRGRPWDWTDCQAGRRGLDGCVHAPNTPCLASFGLGWVCVGAVHHSLFEEQRGEPPWDLRLLRGPRRCMCLLS